MIQESLLEKTVHALVFLGICGAIVLIGWREPLGYWFMSSEKVVELEQSAAADVDPEGAQAFLSSNSRQWHPKGTALDRPPWEKKHGHIYYRPRKGDTREYNFDVP